MLEGDLANAERADGPASLFIDRFAVHMAAGGYGHGAAVVVGGPRLARCVVRASRRHLATGAAVGAAVGAAAATPTTTLRPCGYYPYPPCY